MTTVCLGDDGYDILLAQWRKEGSPNGQFTRLGEHGGELWRVRRDESGNTMFLLRFAAGPSDPGNDKDPETWSWIEQRKGFMHEMVDSGMEFKVGSSGRPGDVEIRVERPPLDETVWDP